jgi:hypothetical protein
MNRFPARLIALISFVSFGVAQSSTASAAHGAHVAATQSLRDAIKAGRPTVIEAEYQLASGEVVRLNTPAMGQK